MDLQDAGWPSGGHSHLHIPGAQQAGHLAAVTAGEGDDGHVSGQGGLRRLDQAAAVGRAVHHQQDVPLLAQGADLLGVGVIIAVIVGHGAQGDGVAIEAEGRQGGTLGLEAVEHLAGKQLGQSRAAAIAAA